MSLNFKGRDVWEFFSSLLTLIFWGTIVAEFLWLIGIINLEKLHSTMPVEQDIQIREPAEPSETWKFLTTPVWEMNKQKE